MGITIKKKLTVRTIKADAAPDASVEGAPADGAVLPDAAAQIPPAEGAPQLAAAPAYAAPTGVKPASYTMAGVFGIIAVIFFIVLVVLQALEWNTFTGCFPEDRPGAPVMSVPAPAAPVVPEAAPPAAPEAAKDAPKDAVKEPAKEAAK